MTTEPQPPDTGGRDLDPTDLLTVAQVAERYPALTERQVRYLIATRRVGTVHIGVRVFVVGRSIDELIRSGYQPPASVEVART